LTECDDHRDVTRPNDTLSDMFDVFSGTNTNAAEDNVLEVNLNHPEADLPDASISAATNVGTEEQHNGTSAAISDGLAFQPLPSIKVAQDALDAMKKLLKPPRVTGGHYKASGLDDLLQERLLEMKRFLWVYIDPNSPSHGKWIMSSMAVAKSLKKKPWHTRGCVRTFIKDHDDLPYNNYGTWNETILEKAVVYTPPQI
jgi:hypothetical protein